MILTLTDAARLSEDEAHALLVQARWPNGVQCPRCQHSSVYVLFGRGPLSRVRQWQCKKCKHRFTVTSGTVLSNRKLSHQSLVISAAAFAANSKGFAALRLKEFFKCQYKTAFILFHKFREALHQEQQHLMLHGEIEIDGAVFGGYRWIQPSPRNSHGHRRQYIPRGIKKIVVVMRERGGRTIPVVVDREFSAVFAIKRFCSPEATLHFDGAHAWDGLQALYKTMRVNHKFRFVEDGACTNWAESYFSVLRRAHLGIYHRMGGPYLGMYASEIAWRQDTRKMAAADRLMLLLNLVFAAKPSVQFSRYWQNRIQSEWEIEASRATKPQEAKCLRCQRAFRSKGPYNRLCLRCANSNSREAA